MIERLGQQKRLTSNQWKLICTANLADLLDFFDLFLIGYVTAALTKECRSLGAALEDARICPAADYYAVKITIAESEQYAVHEEELRTRPGDFGADFLGRALPAVLYSESSL
jgi:hypothetical protein